MTTAERVKLDRNLTEHRDAVATALLEYRAMLMAAITLTTDPFEKANHTASSTQVGSAQRVLFMDT